MKGFELLEHKLENETLESLDDSGGYLTFIFSDGTIIEVVGQPTPEHPGYTEIEIRIP